MRIFYHVNIHYINTFRFIIIKILLFHLLLKYKYFCYIIVLFISIILLKYVHKHYLCFYKYIFIYINYY